MKRFLFAFLALILAVPAAYAQTANYKVQPGDTLQLTVLEDDTLNRTILVPPDGRISVPLAGTIRASGQTVETIEHTIADRLTSNFAVRPNVFVALTEVNQDAGKMKIYVLGRVDEPGVREVDVGTNLLQAVAMAGGLDRFAATKRIQLRRTDSRTGKEQLYLFDFKAVERGAPIASMLPLRDGDVIIVPERRLFE
jgi:polysaccharide biosynthesis/export protein